MNKIASFYPALQYFDQNSTLYAYLIFVKIPPCTLIRETRVAITLLDKAVNWHIRAFCYGDRGLPFYLLRHNKDGQQMALLQICLFYFCIQLSSCITKALKYCIANLHSIIDASKGQIYIQKGDIIVAFVFRIRFSFSLDLFALGNSFSVQ